MHRSGKSHSSVSSGVFSAVQDANVAIFGPLHYEPNYAYPLVVWLHGPGGDERQLRKVMPLVSMRNYVAVGPRGTWADAVGHTWRQGPDDVALAEQRVFEAIDVARCRFNVAENRVFLAGFDCGGTMAFHLAMQHPEAFSGVLSLCGTFPDGGSPLRRIAAARRLPIFMATGEHGQNCSPARVCENLRLFHSAGLVVTLRQYPCGDELHTQMLADMDRWIMSQVLPAAPQPDFSGARRE